MAFYYADGNFHCSETKEPLVTNAEKEGYPLNFVRDPTPFFDDGDAENENYDDIYNGNYSSEIPFSDYAHIFPSCGDGLDASELEGSGLRCS